MCKAGILCCHSNYINTLNTSIQGRNENKLLALQKKIAHWKSGTVDSCRLDMFPFLSNKNTNTNEIIANATEHLSLL